MALHLVLFLIIGAVLFFYYSLVKKQIYWKIRNVPFAKPLPLFGNYIDSFFMRKHFSDILQDICQQYPNEPYIGSFHGTNPVLVVKDPDLLKLIFSKEFFHFNGRETSSHNRKEMLTRNMFFAHGDEWKVLRTNLTPLFSSVKLKNMFYLIKNSADVLESLLEEELTTKPCIDVRCLLSKYTVDIITACAFGISSETMKNNDQKNPFTAVAVKLFDDQSAYRAVKNICRAIWPGLFYALGFKLLEDQVGEFFNNLITEEFRKREETKMSRNDFVDLILSWKRHNQISGDSLSNIKTGDKNIVSIDVTDELLVAQCLLIFGAGFETTSTSVSFLLYELAKNRIAQEKVIEEVDEYFAKHESLEFECINMMPYTESCLAESLRLYPVFSFLTRQVMHEYTLPTGFHFKKDDMVHIPVYHIQHNPEHFPEPESFRPERFLGDAKKNVKPFTYMPFGEGPRMCIGMRFAKMPIYAALLKIFRRYKIQLAENMPQKINFNPKTIFIQPINGIHLKFIPRN